MMKTGVKNRRPSRLAFQQTVPASTPIWLSSNSCGGLPTRRPWFGVPASAGGASDEGAAVNQPPDKRCELSRNYAVETQVVAPWIFG